MVIYFHWQKRIKHHQLCNKSQSNLCNPALFQKLCWGALFSSMAGESWLGSVIQQQKIQFLPVATTIGRVYHLAMVLNSTPVANCSLAGQYTPCTSQYSTEICMYFLSLVMFTLWTSLGYMIMCSDPLMFDFVLISENEMKSLMDTLNLGMLQTCVRWSSLIHFFSNMCWSKPMVYILGSLLWFWIF